MKRTFLLFILAVLSGVTYAQELVPVLGPPILVTPNSANGCTRPRIALVNDSIPLVTWTKTGSGNGIIFCSRWNGSGFGTAVQVTSAALNVYCSDGEGGDIAARGDTAYIVFFSADEVCYCVHSYDGGFTWSDTVRVDHQFGGMAYTPDVEIDADGNPVVGFEFSDAAMLNTGQAVARSVDGGNSFLMETEAHLAVDGRPCECCFPVLLMKDSMRYMVYRNNDINIRNIVMTISSDSGATFPVVSEPDQTNWVLTSCPTAGPGAAFYRDSVAMLWKSSNRLWFGCGHAQTGAAGPDGLFEPSLLPSVVQKHPVVCSVGDTIVCVWDDRRSGTYDCYISISGNGMHAITYVTQLNDTTANAASGTQQTPHAILEGDVIHIVYQNGANGVVVYRRATIGGVVNVEEQAAAQPAVSIYPVPAKESFVISGITEPCTVTIFAMNGEIVTAYSQVVAGQILKSDNLAPGMYTVLITMESGAKSSVPLIKH